MSEASTEEMERQVTTMMDIYTEALNWVDKKVVTRETPTDIPAYMMACHGISEYLEINNFNPQALSDLEQAITRIVQRYLEANTQIPIDPSLN